MIADPILRYALMGALPLLFIAIWWCLRAQFENSGPIDWIGLLRHILGQSPRS